MFQFIDAKGKPVNAKAVGNRVAFLVRQAGVKLTYKSLRRGFGCYWAARAPAQVLQKLMRHHNISLTMTYYANVDDGATHAILGRESSNVTGSRNTPAKASSAEVKENPSSLDS